MTANITVTERAARRIGEILRQELAGTMLRVSVEGGGCSGFQYKFDTERERAEGDIVIEKGGATVLIDPTSLNYMASSEIDFVDDLIGSSFKVNNPKATASCGCGTSFALLTRKRPCVLPPGMSIRSSSAGFRGDLAG
jgi:iron-sulfur cluster assembly accessory protein